MIIQCDNCKTKFKLNEDAIKGAGVKVRCTKCESVFVVTRPDAEPPSPPEAASPEPPPEAPPEPPQPEPPAEEEPPAEDETDWGLGPETTEEAEAPEQEPPSEESVFEEPSAEEETDWGLGPETTEEAEAPKEEPPPEDKISEEISFDEPPVDEEAEAPEEEAEAPEEEAPLEEEISFDEPPQDEEAEVPEEEAPPEDKISEEISFEEPPAEDEAGAGLAEEAEAAGEEGAEEPSEDIDWSLGEEDEDEGADFGEDVDWGLEEEEDAGSVEDYTARLEKELGLDSGDGDLKEAPSEVTEEAAPSEEPASEVETPPAEEPATEEAAQAEEEVSEAEPPAEEAEKDFEGAISSEAPAESAKKGGKSKAIVAILLILIGIGVIYYSGILNNLLSPPKSAVATLEIRDLRGTFVQNEDIGKIYAVEGRIKNISETSQEVLGVKITIFDKAGKSLTSKTVSLARLVSSKELKTLSGEEIDRHYRDLSKGSIPPNGTTPLMAIFSKLPKGMDELVVEVVR